MPSNNSKRVAKNAILLYIRMFIVMGVTIFTSRIILESLGVTDYGVYNVVGGIAFSFGFFSSSLTNATQRYLSFGHGEGKIEKVREYFNLISCLFLIASGLILVIGGALGFWIVSKLNIPSNQYWAGIVVYYCTLCSLIITLFSSVFDSVLIARERMNFYAYISIIEVILKLAVAYLIFITTEHKLQIYAILILGITILVKGILSLYCLKKFPECKFKLIWQPDKLKEVLSFMGWNGLGTVVWVVNEQGVNILLNLFFGPVVNAARGVANQVNSAINNFVNNFFLALNPQIIKTYAAGEYNRSVAMMCKASVFSFLLLCMIALPVILRRDYILHLWLKDVPEYTSVFLMWILIYSLINVFTRPQWTLIQAVGNLKQYILNGCVTMLGAIPVGYILFRYGFAPQSILMVLVCFRSLYVLISIYTIKKFIPFTTRTYTKEVIIPIVSVLVPTFLILFYFNIWLPTNLFGLIIMVIISVVSTITFGITVLPQSYRHQLIGIIKKKF